MKKGTLDTMKYLVLRKYLPLPKYQIVGILEGLWYLTASSAPDGAIGKHSNIEIAAWLEWEGDADDLIDKLLLSGFLDVSDEHRLVVHDWEDHCPTYIRGNMTKYHKTFAKGSPKDTPKQHPKDAPMDAPRPHSQAPTYSIPVNSSLSKPEDILPRSKPVNGAARFPEFWAAYPKKVKKSDALKKWKLKHLDDKADEILADIEIRLEDDKRWKDGFIPDPTTYINGERWNDEVSEYKEAR